jgi:hypothetical protein
MRSVMRSFGTKLCVMTSHRRNETNNDKAQIQNRDTTLPNFLAEMDDPRDVKPADLTRYGIKNES